MDLGKQFINDWLSETFTNHAFNESDFKCQDCGYFLDFPEYPDSPSITDCGCDDYLKCPKIVEMIDIVKREY